MPRIHIVAAVLFLAALLPSCAHHTPAVANNDVVRISGHSTAGLSRHDAVQRALALAAKITVNHGFRYFRILGGEAGGTASLQPGADFAIKLYGEDEGGGPELFDANDILLNGPPAR